MAARACLLIVLALLPSVARAPAQEPIETHGAWRLVAVGEGFALRTQSLDAPDSTLSLTCRKAPNRFAFEIKSPALAALPNGEDIPVSLKVDDDNQVFLTLASGPDGTVPILHLTAFWIIHGELIRKDAKGVVFTAANHAWKFALDGFRGQAETLVARCGFEPARSVRELR